MAFTVEKYKREISAAAAFAVLLIVVGIAAPSFFEAGNLRDLIVNNAATMLIAVGMTVVILAGEIDISVGSQFAVCSIAAGMLARAWPTPPRSDPARRILDAGCGVGGNASGSTRDYQRLRQTRVVVGKFVFKPYPVGGLDRRKDGAQPAGQHMLEPNCAGILRKTRTERFQSQQCECPRAGRLERLNGRQSFNEQSSCPPPSGNIGIASSALP